MLTTIVRADIETAKVQCADIGFKPGTEKYADCVMKLMSKEDNNNEISNNTDKTTKKKDKKVEGDASKLVFEKATYVGEIKKDKADGFGVFTFSDGSTYEGKWRRGILKIKIDKDTRKIIQLRAKTGVHIYLEMKGEGVVSNQWFECECERDFSSCELTPKGKKDQERAKKEKESEGSDDTSGGCG